MRKGSNLEITPYIQQEYLVNVCLFSCADTIINV